MASKPKTTHKLINEIAGLLLMSLALFIFISLISYTSGDLEGHLQFPANREIGNYAKNVGALLSDWLFFTFGWTSYLVSFVPGILGFQIFRGRIKKLTLSQKIGLLLLFFSLPTLSSLLRLPPVGQAEIDPGGMIVGLSFASFLKHYFGLASYLIALVSLVLALILLTSFSLLSFLRLAKETGKSLGKGSLAIAAKVAKRKEKKRRKKRPLELHREIIPEGEKEEDREEEIKEEEEKDPSAPFTPHPTYRLPPLSLLDDPVELSEEELKEKILSNADRLVETLKDFDIEARVTTYHRGPAVTKYELKPAPGVRISRITSLADDIALSLAAPSVRIEAPIPGKQAIGIEIPNPDTATVCIKEIIKTSSFRNNSFNLSLAIGKDISGSPVVVDLQKMPHLLIAGATGSGKSVCINSIIISILYKFSPEEVKFWMIDPKRVELSSFSDIPHLAHPVVTEAKKAPIALAMIVAEMEKRYKNLAHLGVRNISDYLTKKATEEEFSNLPPLPFIVIIVDELADLMMTSGQAVEEGITRLAQMGRAVGIHLVIATQRPSVNVITGLIKANFPTRIAFHVTSQIDSRTILDMKGAEKLLGEGDMLFLPGNKPKPTRLQCSYVSNAEVKRVVKFIKDQAEEIEIETLSENMIEFPTEEEEVVLEEGEKDPLFDDCLRLIVRHNKASTSMLQRYLKIGYNRAARIIDQLEEAGHIAKGEGAKPRKVLARLEDIVGIEEEG